MNALVEQAHDQLAKRLKDIDAAISPTMRRHRIAQAIATTDALKSALKAL